MFYNHQKKKKMIIDIIVEIKEKEISPYYNSTIFGKVFLNWTRYAMKLANKKSLENF